MTAVATNNSTFRVFAGRSSTVLAQRVCEHLKIPVGQAKVLDFPDGEILVKLEEDVRGRDCYLILSTCEPVNGTRSFRSLER